MEPGRGRENSGMKFFFSKEKEVREPSAGYAFDSRCRYELVKLLGRGGMGEVWTARKISAAGHVQNVAVKFMSDPGMDVTTLDTEALRMSFLVHDNIVPFIDSGTDEQGRYFVVMAFIEGMDLNGLRELATGSAAGCGQGAASRIPDKIVGFILFMTLRALVYAHSRDFGGGAVGLIHRDISPGNILLDEREGFVKLADFGVAAVQSKDQSHCQIAGKLPYMAPEVLVEDPINCQVDIYSLGLVAYELVTGFNPNLRPEAMKSVLGAISEVMLSIDRPLRLPHEVVDGVDPALSRIIGKMLEKDRAARYATAADVMADMGVFLFEKGYGPTTRSLGDYLWLMRDPSRRADDSMKQELRFLDFDNCPDAARPARCLSAAARDDLAAGRNPGRVHSPDED